MNFAAIELDDEQRAFWRETRAFFEDVVTDEVHEQERRTGSGYNEAFHRALGGQGWIMPRWPAEEGGAALDSVRARIVEIELDRAGPPVVVSQTTPLPALAVRMFADEQLKAEVLPGVATGQVNLCLGYTEPDCGSDLAAVRTRAVRDGDEWVINGRKMFTTGAQFCQYVLLLTRTDPDAPKHRGLTVFLVPLDSPGIEIRPIGTVGGEKTNFVYYDDVRVPDRYRLGPVNGGWAVLSAPLAAEHGLGAAPDELAAGSGRISVHRLARLLGTVVGWLEDQVDDAGRRRLDDPTVRARLAQVATELENAAVAPGAIARIYCSEALARGSSDLLELVGPAGLLPHGTDGVVEDGWAEYMYRFWPGTTIYGGTTEVHRNIVAETDLGLPRSTPRG
jgi:alkylation response protein AidB-like acyl-CoA dehydrogenase